MRAAVAALAVAVLVTAGTASAATVPAPLPTGPLAPPVAAPPAEPRLSEDAAVEAFLAHPKVERWLERYPPGPTTDASFDADDGTWTVHVWSGKAGEIAQGAVDDADGEVTEAWTGPQVAWQMARGRPGAFGGKTLTSWPVWVGLSAIFFLGLVDLRRPISMRTLDLLALLSFGVSLAFFNRGEVFASASLAVPPLVYLAVRTAWIGFRRDSRAGPTLPRWPVWLLAAATLFLVGFRVGLNVEHPRTVIDVGYAGVVGADRILEGRAPYGAMPVDGGRACAPPRSDGRVRERIQADGRCESTNPRGDTYGPVAYLAYVPAVLAFGWEGRWDDLPAAHATAIGLDLLVLLGLVLVGRRLSGARLAVALAFGWAAYPFTTYALLANTNDALMPALLVWGFWLASSPTARGVATALAGWTKFASFLVAPLWLTYRSGLRPASVLRFVAGFGVATALAFSILLLEPSLRTALETFWNRTIAFQLGRDSPFSIWGGEGTTPRGSPISRHCRRWCRSSRSCSPASSRRCRARRGRSSWPPSRPPSCSAPALADALVLPRPSWMLPFALLAVLAPRTRPADEA